MNLSALYRNVVPEPLQLLITPVIQKWLFLRGGIAAHRQKRTWLTDVQVRIAYHCNLNCKSCMAFSPVTPEKYIDPAVFERDFRRLHELTGGNIGRIRLLGGEPLLHPGITGLMKKTREIFDTSSIELVTNGILLLKQDKSFWETCRDSRIIVFISRYPISINHDEIARIAAEYGVMLQYSANKPQFMMQLAFDVTGGQNAADTFNKCWITGSCVTIEEGKLYSCSLPCGCQFFNDYFHENLSVSDKDFIDIYKVNDLGTILDFLSNPIPFCRYCDFKRIKYGQKWAPSKKEKSEWV
jgi:hypothetical protein